MAGHDFDTPVCGVLGCHEDAVGNVEIEGKGLRTVCEDHADDRELVERVDA